MANADLSSSRQPATARQPPTARNPASPVIAVVAGVWIVSFLWLFFDQTFDDPKIHRHSMLGWILDEALGHSTPLTPAVRDAPAGINYLAQRVPLLAMALPLILAAWMFGDLVLRLFRPTIELLRSERAVLRLGIGLSVLSLNTLLAGQLGWLSRTAILMPAVIAGAFSWLLRRRQRQSEYQPAENSVSDERPRPRRWVAVVVLTLVLPFVGYLILGAMSPPVDFDVREYHLQGPKEWFQQGRITFLSHNVYTSFPFLTEMLSLAGMVVANDWWSGALVGQVILSCFQILSGLATFAIARRWLGTESAWWAALIGLTTPWTLRISLIAYAEGALTFYLTSAVMSALLVPAAKTTRDRNSLCVLTGLLAGSAMSSKYTGLVSVIVPVGCLLALHIGRRRPQTETQEPAITISDPQERIRLLLSGGVLFAAATFLMVAPWLVRNVLDTGNPVYPLGYEVFGGDKWSAEMDARWKPAHAPSEHRLAQIPQHFLDAAVLNKWTSGLLFALAIPAGLLSKRIPVVPLLLTVIGWQFLSWWAFTHRIDRFWIPVIPLMAVAGAACWKLSAEKSWRVFLTSVILFVTIFNLRFCATDLVGFHAGLMDLKAARQTAIRSDLKALNQQLPANAKLLMVGEAEVFDANFALIYNTVFDDCIFEQLTALPEDQLLPVRDQRMLPAPKILAVFREQGITHVYVNWGEILRYRQPGSYGYTEYIQPIRFQQLVETGVLEPPVTLLARSARDLAESDRAIIESWDGGALLLDSDRSFRTVQIFRVRQ